MSFSRWYYGSEGFNLRCERALEDIVDTPASSPEPAIRRWLTAAYWEGFKEGWWIGAMTGAGVGLVIGSLVTMFGT